MALPTLEKTWQFDCNIAIGGKGGAQAADNQDHLWQMKTALLGFASGQWSVTSSAGLNNGAGMAADLSDNWDVYTDLVWGTTTTPHSWIVLTNSANGAQLCFECHATGTEYFTEVYLSPGGGYAATGLVSTARPTPPADEVTLNPNGSHGIGGLTNPWSGKLHAMMSTDGECTRIATCRNNGVVGFLLVDSVKNPATGWTNPVIGSCAGGYTDDADWLTYAKYNDADTEVLSYITAPFELYLTSEGYGTQMIGEATAGLSADSQTSGWVMCPMGLASITADHIGRKGSLYDMWWGSVTRSTGDSYPNDTSYQFAQFGDMILPFDGTLPQVT